MIYDIYIYIYIYIYTHVPRPKVASEAYIAFQDGNTVFKHVGAVSANIAASKTRIGNLKSKCAAYVEVNRSTSCTGDNRTYFQIKSLRNIDCCTQEEEYIKAASVKKQARHCVDFLDHFPLSYQLFPLVASYELCEDRRTDRKKY